MGRASREQAAENRARIVRVASAQFRAKGFEAVGIADVMKEAGLTQGGFYVHFDSKEALAREAWEFSFRAAADAWRDVAAKGSPKRSPIDEITRYYLSPKTPEQTCPMVAWSAEAAALAPGHPMRRAFEEGIDLLFEVYSEAARASDEKLDSDDLKIRFSAMVGANMLSVAAGGRSTAKALRKAVISASR